MALTDVNTEDRLVQQTFADYLRDALGWETVYAFNTETFGSTGTLGRETERDVVLVRDLRSALARLNPTIPADAREQAVDQLTRVDFTRSCVQQNRDFYRMIRDGVQVHWRTLTGERQTASARVLDFATDGVHNNRFLAVRELKVQGVRVPHYNRRADLVCFVNGLPLVFIELKAVYKNIRRGFDENLTDYLNENSIAHAFHHNAFLVVSNGDKARYGSITSKWDHFAEWKRNRENDTARLDAVALLDGMLAKHRLLDVVENFVLFDDSRVGGVRKIVARNHQVMGVNNAVASVQKQEQLKLDFPVGHRSIEYSAPAPESWAVAESATMAYEAIPQAEQEPNGSRELLEFPARAHPDLGRLGVFWHTQGSGKSYSMAFFAEKVRRVVPGNFTFVVMTDREDLDAQIQRTFVGCGVTDEQTPRAASGRDLQAILSGNPRYVFTLIHKFNQPVTAPYSERDDIIVISDEAHRTQNGRFARNMRRALPNAAFIGFTGTPLLRNDQLTRRIFGPYVSRYDFKRSVDDRSTVKLVYDNRGEKLGLARLDLNDRIADAIEQAELDPEQVVKIEKLLGRDYEVVTADDRLDKLAADFVEHCCARWQSGKSMFVCIDKITCARMLQRITPRWQAKLSSVQGRILLHETQCAKISDPDDLAAEVRELVLLRAQSEWMASTIIEIVISEAQNEIRDFARWDFDIVPHRTLLKTGFQLADGKRVQVDDAFRDPAHPFRVAIVCAMWLTGFDVECLSTLYVDKPMKAHSVMQAIARANRVYPGKEFGVIVDYNGILASLRAALADYGSRDSEDVATESGGDIDIVAPLEEIVPALVEAIEAAEHHLRSLGFDVARLTGAKGFVRIEALRDAVDALYSSEDARRRFEIMARQVLTRLRALVTEPVVYTFAERHDNIEAIYRKLDERSDATDITGLMKELHRIVNEAIRAAEPGADHADGLMVDLSQLDFTRLRNEFASKVARKNTAVQDMSTLVEQKLARMLAVNPLRMDFYRKYQEIIADYNREKDRATVESTFAQLLSLAASLDAEQRRAVEEGLSEEELALFDLLSRDDLTSAARERLKQASQRLLTVLREVLATMRDWTSNATTQATVRVLIADNLSVSLPRPPYTEREAERLTDQVYNYVWQRSAGGNSLFA